MKTNQQVADLLDSQKKAFDEKINRLEDNNAKNILRMNEKVTNYITGQRRKGKSERANGDWLNDKAKELTAIYNTLFDSEALAIFDYSGFVNKWFNATALEWQLYRTGIAYIGGTSLDDLHVLNFGTDWTSNRVIPGPEILTKDTFQMPGDKDIQSTGKFNGQPVPETIKEFDTIYTRIGPYSTFKAGKPIYVPVYNRSLMQYASGGSVMLDYSINKYYAKQLAEIKAEELFNLRVLKPLFVFGGTADDADGRTLFQQLINDNAVYFHLSQNALENLDKLFSAEIFSPDNNVDTFAESFKRMQSERASMLGIHSVYSQKAERVQATEVLTDNELTDVWGDVRFTGRDNALQILNQWFGTDKLQVKRRTENTMAPVPEPTNKTLLKSENGELKNDN